MDVPLLAAAGSADPASLWTAHSLSAFMALTLMEIVLGIDNIVFVAILVGEIPKKQQRLARNIGLSLALLLRLGLLFSVTWVMSLTAPWIQVPDAVRDFLRLGEDFRGFSGKDLILIAGGLFLLYKASKEIFERLEGEAEAQPATWGSASLHLAILQIILLDLVFSLDSVITAMGMANQITIMATAMFVAVGIMIVAAGKVSDFVHHHPSIKILALSFLNLIGVMLLLQGMQQPVNKGYIYSAMAFALLVELLNMHYRKKLKQGNQRKKQTEKHTARPDGA
jgi:predicted tellurium resistance membrane protein TerC